MGIRNLQVSGFTGSQAQPLRPRILAAGSCFTVALRVAASGSHVVGDVALVVLLVFDLPAETNLSLVTRRFVSTLVDM
jgi:hypothetical protein